ACAAGRAVMLMTLHIPIDRSCGIGASGGAALLMRAAGGGILLRLVLVVALHPFHDLVLVPSLRREIEEVVRADQDVAAARVAGIGVEHLALVVPVEDAHARQLVERILSVDVLEIVVHTARKLLLR